MISRRIARMGVVVCTIAGGCGGEAPVTLDLSAPMPDQLSSINLFGFEEGEMVYNDRVVPYRLNTPLFSDYAGKERALYLPEGEVAVWQDYGSLEFPVGSLILKSFLVPENLAEPAINRRLVETRLLVRYESGWKAFPYVWDEDELDATLTIEGEIRELDIVDQDGLALTLNYLVPQRNQCLECHEVKDEDGGRVVVPVGPWVRNLHLEADYGDGMVNQLTYLFEQGMLNDASGLGDVPPAMNFDEVVEGGLEQLDYDTLNTVTRDYLDINCAHCHRPNGVQGITSQLFLNYDNEDEFNLGVCKKPGSAAAGTGGHTYDIVPGSPEESILQFRVETDEVGAMMPLLGRSLVHREGAELTRAWILGMPGEGCEP